MNNLRNLHIYLDHFALQSHPEYDFVGMYQDKFGHFLDINMRVWEIIAGRFDVKCPDIKKEALNFRLYDRFVNNTFLTTREKIQHLITQSTFTYHYYQWVDQDRGVLIDLPITNQYSWNVLKIIDGIGQWTYGYYKKRAQELTYLKGRA